MKSTAPTRIVAALMSVTVTLFVLNALALYGHPEPVSAEAQITRNTTTVVASVSK